ncbi:MAG: hypothetical protein IPL61_40670 [Myxococcales bacterium]|nr:hypothetical protein [Myxococcales bacterium]
MRGRLIAIGCAAGLVAAAPAATAEPRWYGERIVAIDGTSDALLLVGLFGDSELAAYAGLAGYVLGGPIIHATQGEWNRAGGSLGLRLALPAVGGVIGHRVCVDDSGLLRCVGSLVVGLAVGGLIAQVVDPALLAYTDDGAPAPTLLRLGGQF